MNKLNGRMADHDRDSRMPQVDGAVRIALGNGVISDIAASPDGSRLFVTNYGRDSVSVIDTDTYRVVETVEGLDEPSAVAMGSHSPGRAYVSTACTAYDAIAVVDARVNTVIASHRLANRVSDLAVHPDGAHVYASRNGADGGDLAVLDVATGGIEAVDLPTAPQTTTECVRVDSGGSRLYVATNDPAGGELVVLRADGRPRVVDTVAIGRPIRDVALSPDGGIAYVAGCAPDFGAVIDVIDTRTRTITQTYKPGDIGGILTGLVVSDDGDRAYLVSDTGITVLCMRTHDIVGTVAATDQPSRVIQSPDARHLYIADHSGAVTVEPIATTAEPTDRGEITERVEPGPLRREPALL